MAEHEAEIETGAGGHTEFALVEGQHPVEPEREVHLARQAIVATHVGRDVEEGLLMEGAVLVRFPAVLVTIQDIQSLHGTAAYHAADIRPGFVQPPATIG